MHKFGNYIPKPPKISPRVGGSGKDGRELPLLVGEIRSKKTRMQTLHEKLSRKTQSAELGTVSGSSCTKWDFRTDADAESSLH